VGGHIGKYKGEFLMMMPKTIASWCTVLFFLIFGLTQTVGFFQGGFWPMLAGLLALGAAVFTFIGK
jgi:hypothetical protein